MTNQNYFLLARSLEDLLDRFRQGLPLLDDRRCVAGRAQGKVEDVKIPVEKRRTFVGDVSGYGAGRLIAVCIEVEIKNLLFSPSGTELADHLLPRLIRTV
ncbi:hypothetical protein GGQ10_003111 [Salinibacter ruber]|nr:hypothetical protein [Salinibacter ruber]MCS4088264.1 hypothetical protein [Salinibacter ruber]